MLQQHVERPPGPTSHPRLGLRDLIGSGDRIMLLTLPFLIVGLGLNIAFPSIFGVGGPRTPLRVVSMIVLITGVAIWLWSVVLMLARARRGELITVGPFRLVKHPIYTSVALLVVPWVGFLLDTWLGVFVGVVMYVGARLFAPAEETALSETFGNDWERYRRTVVLPWL